MSDVIHTLATRSVVRDGVSGRTMRPYVLRGDAVQERVTATSYRVGGRPGADLVLADPRVSRLHFEISVDAHGYRLRDLGSTNGTVVDGYRANDLYLRPGSEITVGDTTLRFTPEDDEVDVPASPDDRFGPLVGASVAMRELFALLAKAAPTDATLLVEGESGTGKELVAEAVHAASGRAGGPLVVFDCAAIPTQLMESELFGHEKGAFTGATSQRVGRMEEADGGTLFLDELGELPLDLQPKLLRALEKREVRRVGGARTRRVDFRGVAATNRDLAAEVNRGAFREDLYYRLAVVRVRVPPLRERAEDVPRLVEHFVRRALPDDAKRAAKILASISEENRARLMAHPWPGNVRELKNLIQRTLALSTEDDPAALEPQTAPGLERRPAASDAPEPVVDLDRPFSDLKKEVVESFERNYLTRQLARHEGNYSRAAAASGMDRMYFKRMLKKRG